MKTYDLDQVDFINGKMALFNATPDIQPYIEMLERWHDGQLYHIGLSNAMRYPYQRGGGGRGLLAVAAAPSPPREVPAELGPVDRSSSGGLTKEELRTVFVRAWPIASRERWSRMPDWSSNEALDALVFHESGRKPYAQNRTSTAYGLFQFLDSTWRGYGIPKTSDPVMQAAAGMRYVYSRYRTPERALAFQRATVLRRPELAPADMRPAVNEWIRKGASGY